MTKYGISSKDLYKVRKLIIKDLKSNNKVNNPICNMTLQNYLDIIKECMLSLANKNGIVLDEFNSNNWYSKSKKQNIINKSSVDVAKDWMDGRGLFTEHFNNNINNCIFGNWENIDSSDQNKWYHKDRLNDINWFKQCILGGIGRGGHPTENILISNIDPMMYEENKWYILFGCRQNPYGTLKSYLHLKEKGIPCFIYNSEQYLTKSQLIKLSSI